MTFTDTSQQCALCEVPLSKDPIRNGDHAFCCTGCHAVFQILSTKNALHNFQDHPIFKQALKAGLISNPLLLEKIRSQRPQVPEEELQKLHLEITDMWCPFCAEVIKLVLLQEKGVRNCVVDYVTDLASIEYAPRYLSKEQIEGIISSLGYQPKPLQEAGKTAVSQNLYLRFAVAVFCAVNIMMFAYPIYVHDWFADQTGMTPIFAWISLALSLPIVTYCSWPIIRRFLTSLQVGLFGMETLVVISLFTAFGLSLYNLLQGNTHVYFDSMSMVIVLVLLGKIIESKAKFSARDSLFLLTRSLPRRGRKRFPDGSQSFVLLKEINPGDILVALTGEKIVLDGVVVEGSGACDESLMTGESVPIIKKMGSGMLGGSVLSSGVIAFRVTTSLAESALQRIITLIEQDISQKSLYLRAADRIVRWFVPSVIVLAVLTAAICWISGVVEQGKTVSETACVRAVSILLISCPCAIGIAAPLAESLLMSGLAGLGAIVRNRGCLRLLGKETVFVFDKTGTITEGRFAVRSGLEQLSSPQKKRLKAIASHSTHPISCAVAEAIEEQGNKMTSIEEHPGRGVIGYDDQDVCCLGSLDFLREQGIEVDASTSTPEDQIVSQVYYAENRRYVACLTLGDSLREHAKEVITALAPTQRVLLSGDAPQTVAAVGKACGFDVWKASCQPLQKREFIEEMRQKGEIVCMLGDGINDAPALTVAHIGISVVSATDLSIQVSDILLTTDNLKVIPKIRGLGKKGAMIVRQNLFWAFFYNVVGIVLAVFGVLSPLFAAFAMTVSSLIVTFNSLRLKRMN